MTILYTLLCPTGSLVSQKILEDFDQQTKFDQESNTSYFYFKNKPYHIRQPTAVLLW